MAKKQPELYRIPRKPGYLGGYDWRATALGCLLLVVVNFVATQYIAAKFQYQPALGAPILRAKSGGVYQPFSWIAWGWRYCTSQDERIRRPFFEGEMIVFAGSLACVGIFFVLAGRRARQLTENAEDLHGSARWADEDDTLGRRSPRHTAEDSNRARGVTGDHHESFPQTRSTQSRGFQCA